MFTSEPSLTQRIERMIRDTPIIDPRTRIRCDQPNAPDHASLLSHDAVKTQLRAVGMPPEDNDSTLPADERVRRAIPYLARMRNTAVSWCFYRILRDLYDFHDPNLTEANYRDVFDRVEATARDPRWASQILRERCRVGAFATSLANRSVDPSKNPPEARFMLDADDLVCPGRTTGSAYYRAVMTSLGPGIDTSEALRRRLLDRLEATVRGDVRFTSLSLPIGGVFLEPDPRACSAVLDRAAAGNPLSDAEVDVFARSVSWTLLEWHHEHRKVIQIGMGPGPFPGADGGVRPLRDSWTREIADVFQRFGNARFDLRMAFDVLWPGAAVLAQAQPNVYVSCDWWQDFAPPAIERGFSVLLRYTPMTKFGGFSSDAETVEWSYGKLQVASKAMASAFADEIDAGSYEEDEVPAILRQILYQTPRDLYDLG
jgi:hypothetical protein